VPSEQRQRKTLWQLATQGCPCEYYGDTLRSCTRSETVVTRYQKRLTGPLLDRMDIHPGVPRVEYEKLAGDRAGEPSSAVRQPGGSAGAAAGTVRGHGAEVRHGHGAGAGAAGVRAWGRRRR
jgi:predicted ATPase with chaperone activity